MAASYPSSLVTSTQLPPQTDGSSIVDAADVNNAYLEIIAIEENLGTNPAQHAFGTGTFSLTPATTTLANRVKNIEQGVAEAWTALNFTGGVAYLDGGTSSTSGY